MTIRSLQAASALVFGYLFIGEAVGGISGAAAKATRVLQHWAVQQIILSRFRFIGVERRQLQSSRLLVAGVGRVAAAIA